MFPVWGVSIEKSDIVAKVDAFSQVMHSEKMPKVENVSGKTKIRDQKW